MSSSYNIGEVCMVDHLGAPELHQPGVPAPLTKLATASVDDTLSGDRLLITAEDFQTAQVPE